MIQVRESFLLNHSRDLLLKKGVVRFCRQVFINRKSISDLSVCAFVTNGNSTTIQLTGIIWIQNASCTHYSFGRSLIIVLFIDLDHVCGSHASCPTGLVRLLKSHPTRISDVHRSTI